MEDDREPEPEEVEEEKGPLAKALAIFAMQHSVAADRQVREVGVSLQRQQTLMRQGLWGRYSPGVLALAGVSRSWNRSASAATLMPGARALITAGAGARVHQLDGCLAVDTIAVLIPNNSRLRAPADVTVLRSRVYTDEDHTVVNGIPVTTVGVTLLFLQVHGPNAGKALDSALLQGNSPTELNEVFERWRGYGVEGPREMLSMLHERVSGRLPRSWFQRLAKRLLAEFGLVFVDEWPVYDEFGTLLAVLDLACVQLQVGVECQSWEHHGSPAAQRADNDRKRNVRQRGWDIADLWWSDLNRMDAVVADIRLALERARLIQLARSLPARTT